MTQLLRAGTDTAPSPPIAAPADHSDGEAGTRKIQVGAAWLMSSTVILSLLNYAYTLCLMWWLPAGSYSVFASASALLLICGTIATASAPWVLAQEVAEGRADPERRRSAVSFCMAANLVQGGVAAAITVLVASRYGGGLVLGVVAGAVLMIFAAATAVGYLQGQEHFRLIATLRLAEVIVKIGGGLALVGLGAGAGGALAGYALGGAVVAAVGVVVMAPDIRLRLAAVKDRDLWSRAHGVLLIQAAIAILAGSDVVLGSLLITNSTSLATYQVSLIIARIPMVLAGAISIAVFSRLSVQRQAPESAAQVRTSLLLFLQTAVPIVMVAATLPAALTSRIFAPAYHSVGSLLPWTALAGGLLGGSNLVSTFFQAQCRFRRPLRLLGAGLAVHLVSLAVGIAVDGTTGLAIGSVIGAGVVFLLLVRETGRVWAGSLRGVVRATLWGVVTAAPLPFLHHHVFVWLAWVALVIGPLVLRAIFRRRPALAGRSSSSRPRVLHLAFEDPRRPGAGGGSVRTHEINRRLAARWDITAVCARYPGCAERVEDGVRYVHVGRGSRYFPTLLSYFACLPLALRRYPSDLVVEDFAAPFGSIAIPWLTGRPVVGVVQWLFAAQMREKYHLPFPLVERLGVRAHRRLIAVSEDLGAELRARNPRAEVTTVRNGLDEEAFAARPVERPRADALFLGRLDIAQKGLDLLLDAFAAVAGDVNGDLLVAGDGPDGAVLRARVDNLGLGSRVHFLGRVAAAERFDLLARAQLVVMPSRFETFGMVAAEAMAVGTPVLSFDIPCLRELATPATGVQVAAFDVAAYGAALAALLGNPGRCARLGAAGPGVVKALCWDDLARSQEEVYRRALTGEPISETARPSEVTVAATVEAGVSGAELTAAALDGAAGGVPAGGVPAGGVPDSGTGQGPETVGPAMARVRPVPRSLNPGRLVAETVNSISQRRLGGRRPRVLMIGNIGNGNVGDEAVFAGLAPDLSAVAEVTVVTRDPGAVRGVCGVSVVTMVSWRAVRQLLATDVIAVGGGGIFGAGMPPLVRLLPFVLCFSRLVLGKRIVFQAIGAYSTTPQPSLGALRVAGRLADAVLVRDEASRETFRGGLAGRGVEPVLVGDPAIFLAPAEPEEAWETLRSAGVRSIPRPLVISLKPTPEAGLTALMVAALAGVAEWWCQHRFSDVVILPLSKTGDYGRGPAWGDAVLGRLLAEGLPDPSRIKILPPDLRPALAKAVVGEAEFVIAVRLHASIFAWSMGVPVLTLPFEEKTVTWLAQTGGAGIPLPHISAEAIVKFLESEKRS